MAAVGWAVTSRTTCVGAAGEAGGNELIAGAAGGRTGAARGGSFNGVRVGMEVEANGATGAAGVGGGLVGTRPAA